MRLLLLFLLLLVLLFVLAAVGIDTWRQGRARKRREAARAPKLALREALARAHVRLQREGDAQALRFVEMELAREVERFEKALAKQPGLSEKPLQLIFQVADANSPQALALAAWREELERMLGPVQLTVSESAAGQDQAEMRIEGPGRRVGG